MGQWPVQMDNEKPVYPHRVYFWMLPPDVWSKKPYKSRWRMTEAQAARCPGAVKIEADSLLIEKAGEPHGR